MKLLQPLAIVAAIWITTSCSSDPKPLAADDWSETVPFEFIEPSPVSRLLRLEGTISFSGTCAEVAAVGGDGETEVVHAIVLPSTSDLRWSETTKQLRIGDVVIPHGASVVVDVHSSGISGFYESDSDCSDLVTVARGISLA